MKYCINCLQNDLRPNTEFLSNGLCPACNYKKKSKDIDWNEREKILKKILIKTKNIKNKKNYDCILGVSGGKDSTRQALWLRDKFNLKILLACLSYPPQQVTNTGTDNISNLINLGFDCYTMTLSPKTWKNLMKVSFLKYGNWAKSTELALFSFVPRLALQMDIPLVFWGENPALQLGDSKSGSKKGFDGKNIMNLNTLGGGKLDWIPKSFKKNKLFPYLFPKKKYFKSKKINIIYLGWFMRDWSLINNAKYSISYGLKIRKKIKYNIGDLFRVTSLDEDWVMLNQMIKYYKFGFGRVTDYLNEEIRDGKISRKTAINILKKYEGKCHKKVINSFCKYIEISTKKFWIIVLKNVNKKLFKVKGIKNGVPIIKRNFEFGKNL